jgi:HlyD family secretion protein
MKLLDPHRLYVRAELDEVDMGSVKVGLPVRVTLDPYKDRKFQGTITKILPYVTEEKEQNRTVIIEVELDPGLDGVILKHGLSADVEVILRTKPDVVRIPTLALLEGSKVLVVDSTQKAKTVKVKVGLKNWEFAEVLEGVSLGDPIIVSLESEKVKEGVPVKIVQESEK